jgi:hypothetical protein
MGKYENLIMSCLRKMSINLFVSFTVNQSLYFPSDDEKKTYKQLETGMAQVILIYIECFFLNLKSEPYCWFYIRQNLSTPKLLDGCELNLLQKSYIICHH